LPLNLIQAYKDINNKNKYKESGVHQIPYQNFEENMWARQTQFKNILQSIKNSNDNSKSAKHLHNN
jgi:hypothetical protein